MSAKPEMRIDQLKDLNAELVAALREAYAYFDARLPAPVRMPSDSLALAKMQVAIAQSC